MPGWNGTLYAFDRSDGELRNQVELGMPLRAAPLVHGGRIFQPSGDGHLTALLANGKILWRKGFAGGLLTTPLAYQNQILVLDKQRGLSALNAQGELLWQRSLGQPAFYSHPLLVGRALYIATAAGGIWKIDAKSGDVVWTQTIGASIYAPPSACEAGLLVADNNGMLRLIDFDSGRTLATYTAAGAIQSKPLVTGNRLYFGSRDHKLHAVAWSTGEDLQDD